MFNWYAALPDGTVTDELTTARDRKVTWRLDAPGEASFTLHGDPNGSLVDQTPLVNFLQTDLFVTYNGESTYGWRGRLGANGSSGSLTETSYSEQWNAVDYRGILNRRYVRTALSYTEVDTAAIASALIDHTHTGVAGPTGINVGSYGTFASTDWNIDVGKSVGEQIDELAAIFPGFDWWVDPNMTLRMEFRGGGATKDFPLEYPTTCSEVSWSFDPAAYGNTIIQTGADASTVPVVDYADDLATRPEGRWELVASDPDIATQPALNATAQTNLVRAAASGVSHTFTLKPDTWTPEQLWIGDHVNCRYETTRGRRDFLERVHEITVTDDGDDQKVTVSVGNRLAADLAAMNRRIVQTLNKLARRS